MYHLFARGLLDSVSIGVGYVPIAFSFGLASLQAEIGVVAAVLMSALMFAGGSQFVLLGLISAGSGIVTAISVILLVNIRHIFYGPTLMDSIGKGKRNISLPILAFGLTDEVMALSVTRASSIDADQRDIWFFGLWIGSYLAWVLGTALGVATGQEIFGESNLVRSTLNFILPTLFFSLLLEIGLNSHRNGVAGAILGALAAWTFMPTHIAILLGIAFGVTFTYLGNKITSDSNG